MVRSYPVLPALACLLLLLSGARAEGSDPASLRRLIEEVERYPTTPPDLESRGRKVLPVLRELVERHGHRPFHAGARAPATRELVRRVLREGAGALPGPHHRPPPPPPGARWRPRPGGAPLGGPRDRWRRPRWRDTRPRDEPPGGGRSPPGGGPEQHRWQAAARDFLLSLLGRFDLASEPPATPAATPLPDEVYRRLLDAEQELYRRGPREDLTPLAGPLLRALLESGRLGESDLRELWPRAEELVDGGLEGEARTAAWRDLIDEISHRLGRADRRVPPPGSEDGGSTLASPGPAVTPRPSPGSAAGTPVVTAPGAGGGRQGRSRRGRGAGGAPSSPPSSLLLTVVLAFLGGLVAAGILGRRGGAEVGGAASDDAPTPGPVGRPQDGPALPARYTGLTLLGRGGMGRVYRAHDARLNREVAVKVLDLPPGEGTARLDRFRREAEALAALDHPGVLKVWDVAVEETPHLVLELLDGETLESELARRGQLGLDELVELGSRLLDALEHAHQRGVLHRDVTPRNVQRTADGGTKLLDFGLARLARDSTLTREGEVLGTLPYMAPEQLEGRSVDARSDLWSVAAVLHHAWTGELPYPLDAAQARLVRPPDSPSQVASGVPPVLDEVLGRAMAVAPGERYPDAAAFREALLRAARRRNPVEEWLTWVNALILANGELFHPLKGRFALSQRYRNRPDRILALLDEETLEELRQQTRRAREFLEACGRSPLEGKERAFRALGGLAGQLGEVERGLAAPTGETVAAVLGKGFEVCKKLADLAAGMARSCRLDLREWARGLAGQAGGELDVHLGSGWEQPSDCLFEDRERAARELSRVAEVLLVNAREAGASSLRLDLEADGDEDRLRLGFVDDGPGLPPGNPEELFRPGASGKEGGSGTGLADARLRARGLGGELVAARDPGGGAAFWVTLPRRRARLPEGVPAPGAAAGRVASG